MAGAQGVGPGTRVAGKYLIQQQLGKGGFGTVFRATHELLGRDEALKLMNPDVAQNPLAAKRFFREVRSSEAVVHRYAVQLRDVGRDDVLGCLYFTMDLVKGKTLAKTIEREGPLAPERVVVLGGQVLEVLALAHEEGLVHRDLKPGNLMLTVDDGEEEVRVLDFGIAKAIRSAQGDASSGLTMAGTTVGTLAYMSPEQAQGLALTGTSDLYAMGTVLYEALSGRRPIQPKPEAVDRDQSLLFQIVASPPRPLAEVAPWVPEPLQRVVMQALAKSPSARFSDADAMRAALLACTAACRGIQPPAGHAVARPAVAAPDTESFGRTGPRPVVPSGPTPAAGTESFGVTGIQPTAPAARTAGTESFGVTGVQPAVPPTRRPQPVPPTRRPPARPPEPPPMPATHVYATPELPPQPPAQPVGRIGDTIEVEPPAPLRPAAATPANPEVVAMLEMLAMIAPPGVDVTEALGPHAAGLPSTDALLARVVERFPELAALGEAELRAMCGLDDGGTPTGGSSAPLIVEPLQVSPPPRLPQGVSPTSERGVYLNEREGSLLVWVPPGSSELGTYEEALIVRPNDGRAQYTKRPTTREVTISRGYFIAQQPVTWAQYERFCHYTGRTPPERVISVHGRFVPGDDHPVVQVSWEDAAAYCAWAEARLPTSAEWELAARGPEGLPYPWGYEAPNPSLANYGSGDRRDPGADADGFHYTSPSLSYFVTSPYGCVDMVGNAWEWTADWAETDAEYSASWERIVLDRFRVSILNATEEQIEAGLARMQELKERDPQGPAQGVHKIAHGGSWAFPAQMCQSAAQLLVAPGGRRPDLGFRLARSLG